VTTFLRFVTGTTDTDSHVAQGIFQSAYALREDGALEEHEALWYEEVVGWFDEHLHAPKRIDFSLRWFSTEHERVIFWLKDTATEHIQRMREMCALLSHYGVATRVLRTERPGTVVYEDEHQVGAIPFRDGVK